MTLSPLNQTRSLMFTCSTVVKIVYERLQTFRDTFPFPLFKLIFQNDKQAKEVSKLLYLFVLVVEIVYNIDNVKTLF